jgi:hypothetical protein
MDVTSHSITLISIVIGLGLTELLLNLHRLIHARDRVRWDPLPVLWAATVLLMLLNYWWALVLRRDGSQLASTAAEYGLLLVHPLLLFLLCASVLPRLASEDGLDMRRAYERDRRAFVVVFVVYMLANWILAFATGTRLWSGVTLQRAAVSILLVSLLMVNARRWDWFVAIGVTVTAILRIATQTVR